MKIVDVKVVEQRGKETREARLWECNGVFFVCFVCFLVLFFFKQSAVHLCEIG